MKIPTTLHTPYPVVAYDLNLVRHVQYMSVKPLSRFFLEKFSLPGSVCASFDEPSGFLLPKTFHLPPTTGKT